MTLRKTFLLQLILVTCSLLLYATEPIATITSPTLGTPVLAGTTVTISGTVTGNLFEYYELHFATGNLQSWVTTGLSIPNSTTKVANSTLATWDTTGLNLSNWAIRLRAQTTDGYKAFFFLNSIADSSTPAINSVSIENRTTGLNTWVKNGDALIISANLSDTQTLTTENIWADLTDFGGSRYTAPTDWTVGTSGTATWIITVNIQSSKPVSAMITVQDFGNNLATSKLQISADITAPEIYVYLNGLRLFKGDYFDGLVSLNSSISENNSIVNFSLSLYNNGVLLKSDSNTNGATLNISYSSIDSRTIQVIAVAKDIAGNITTANITEISSTTSKMLTEVMCAPNPFNPNQEISSHIGYKISQPGKVSLYLHDIIGKRIFSTSQFSNLGYGEFTWDGLNSEGVKVPNGLYFAIVIVEYTNGGESKFATKIAVLR